MSEGVTYGQGDNVHHGDLGQGSVMLDNGQTVVVRFITGIHECLKSELRLIRGVLAKLHEASWDPPLEVVNRLQAECITSVNDMWGVFSVSRIQLLPHQLWVCRKVNSVWPARWMIADDVGLGKTIEAGMILWPLIANGMARRLLILCPASLVEQWQYRMRTMFDIRIAMYSSDQDTERSGYWQTQDRVVASVHTLRLDQRGRQDRMLDAEPWDLVIVDEAHHLNNDEHAGPTLSYKLVKQLQDRGLVRSLLFFTGTPHRGKDYGFLSLLQLLRPDKFDPKQPASAQLQHLPGVMIRNNKRTVTDLRGNRLFQETFVRSHEYTYSAEESAFYDALTQFIASGRAYASGLASTEGRAVILVLIAMQKLASSSVAAIRKALKGRRERILAGGRQLEELKDAMHSLEEAASSEETDAVAALEEEITTLVSSLQLMKDEVPFLNQLIEAADRIGDETKVQCIVDTIRMEYPGRQILLFTEYKATQSLLMSALMREYGSDCVTFINGDERADDVSLPNGTVRTFRVQRQEAARLFNAGRVRFLISTEAGGEGIDLQERCHTLIHVDLPWNPMRLHQRVGRLNRYGQKERVEVLSFRNPDTVESLIWDKLNEKLERISLALRQVMDEPEDLLQLVLGMTSPSVFNEVFSEAGTVRRESLSDWFDEKTATFGGDDVVATVKQITGNASKYDFQDVSSLLPRVDLPDLAPFVDLSLSLNGRRLREDSGRISFLTPDVWKRDDPLVKTEYSGLSLDRNDESQDLRSEVIGVGHRVLAKAIDQAKAREVSVAAIPKDILPSPVVVYRIHDKVTTGGGSVRSIVAGVRQDPVGSRAELILDWELLRFLNSIPRGRQALQDAAVPELRDIVISTVESSRKAIERESPKLDHGFRLPQYELMAVLWPHVI